MAAVRAATKPAGPPPMTITFLGWVVFVKSVSYSRPTLGLTKQVTHPPVNNGPSHPWRHPIQ